MAGKLFFFDVIRGLSAQMVLLGHALNVCFPAFFMQAARPGYLEARPGLFYIQNLGVLIFFCISGYLVTQSVVRRAQGRSYRLGEYLLDRFARIFTPLLPLLALLFVVDNALGLFGWPMPFTEVNADFRTLVLNATMLFDHAGMSAIARMTGLDVLRAGAFGTADQLWTVVIEWWIYIAFGITAFALLDRKWPSLMQLALLLFAASAPVYLLFKGNGLLLAWIVGMSGALLQPRISAWPVSVVAAIAFSAAFLAVTQAISNGFNLYDPVFAMSFALVLVLTHRLSGRLDAVNRHAWSVKVLAGMSEISYSVYLVHLSVLLWAVAWKPQFQGHPLALLGLCVAANAVSIAFYFAFERHYPVVRRWLGKLFPQIGIAGKLNA
jgi:peptidoglycan/LPS O-acetylase OafA/YrhL